MTFTVTYTPHEQSRIHALAMAFQDNKGKHQVCNQKINPHMSDIDIHQMGISGESAVALLLGVDIDSTVYVGADTGADLMWQGKTLQVKTGRPLYDFNLKNTDANGLEDINVLCWYHDQGAVEVVGYLERDEAIAKHHIADYGYGRRFSVKHEHFKPMARLMRYVGQ